MWWHHIFLWVVGVARECGPNEWVEVIGVGLHFQRLSCAEALQITWLESVAG